MFLRLLHLFTDSCMAKDVGSLRLDRVVLFMIFAPTFRLGPVTRYVDINEQFDNCASRITRENVRAGLLRILVGCVQFTIINKGIDEFLVDPYRDKTFFFLPKFFADAPNLSTMDAVIGMYLIAFRFLLGFSAYSHIAIGLSRIIGIDLPENFHWPNLATNLQDFWRRWHMTMGAWLRDYVYIPLGGHKRRFLSVPAVFVYCFLWHQPTLNMLVFALLHTAGITADRSWRRFAEAHNIARGRIWGAVGLLLTFHFWCLTLLVLFDPQHCGLPMIRRILILPFTSS